MLKRKIKFGLSNYFKPTPKKLRIFGDTLLTLSLTASTYSAAMENKMVAIIVMIVGVAGKFITNMFGPNDK